MRFGPRVCLAMYYIQRIFKKIIGWVVKYLERFVKGRCAAPKFI